MTNSTPPADKSRKKPGSKELPVQDILPETVEAFLEKNPSFLKERTDLLAIITPPEKKYGENVVDMQKFMVQRLQNELAEYKKREKNLLKLIRENSDVQTLTHKAVKALLDAKSFEELIKIILHKIPKVFDITAVALCIEAGKSAPATANDLGIIVIKSETLESLMDAGRSITLRSNIQGDKIIFGTQASKVKSTALLRLNFGSKLPNGLLALGHNSSTGFDPQQGTELLSFFSYVLQRTIKRWLIQNM
ncbi:MAG: hypothetical protein CMM75_07370 [Rhodospirillaceae bacterium]|nr:hypothetical protein [Rhodospirillaceae bacterium]